jgi:hypothetical protein
MSRTIALRQEPQMSIERAPGRTRRGGYRVRGAPWRMKEAAILCRCTEAHLSMQARRGRVKTIEIGGLRLLTEPEMSRLTGLTADQLHDAWTEINAMLAGGSVDLEPAA